MRTTFEALDGKSLGNNRYLHPIVWVEDIHSCDPSVAVDVSTALVTFFTKVVHTVSEDKGSKMLKPCKLRDYVSIDLASQTFLHSEWPRIATRSSSVSHHHREGDLRCYHKAHGGGGARRDRL